MRRGSSANYRGEPMSDAVYVVVGFKGVNGNLRFGLSEDPLGYVQNV